MLFQTTADIALEFEVIANPATDDAYMSELAELAVQDLEEEGVDVFGSDYVKEEVEVTPGGE